MGGKGIIREIVRLLFPPWADRYAEHFFGGGGILFGTPPRPGVVEVVNDYDSDLVNFYLCLRDRPFALMAELNRLPLQSEAEFIQLKRFLSGQEIMPDFSLDELRIARQSLTPEQFEEIAPILQGRAELWDVRIVVERPAPFVVMIVNIYLVGSCPFASADLFHLKCPFTGSLPQNNKKRKTR